MDGRRSDGETSNADAGPPQGVRVWRGAEVESIHAVHAAVVDAAGGEIGRIGTPERRAYLRSAAKPVQLLPLVEEGLVDRYGFTSEEVAVMVASHSGEPHHVQAVERILDKAGLHAGMLQCGPHAPFHGPSAEALRRRGLLPTALHNNCSGKHASMLAVCRAKGWALDTYRQPDHPLQRRIRDLVAELADLAIDEIGNAIDGCGVPTFALPVEAMAILYARLAASDAARDTDRARAVGVVFDAMAAHPGYVAGSGRVCTDVLARAGERVVVKTGAEGVHCAALRGRNLGLALKVADGGRRAQSVALLALLAELGVLDPRSDPVLADHLAPDVANREGVVVGRIDAWLPLSAPV